MIKIKRLIALLNGEDLTPQTALEKAVKTFAVKVTAALLPEAGDDDNGKVMGVTSGKWTKVTPADYAPVAAAGTQAIDGSTVTLTLDKKAADLYTAISAGRLLKVTIAAENTEAIFAVTAVKTGTGNSVVYSFGFMNEGGILFSAEELAGTADVVMTATISSG